MGKKRRVFALVLVAVLGAATALAYGHAGVATLTTHASATDEPVLLLLSGSALLAVAGALRRLSL